MTMAKWALTSLMVVSTLVQAGVMDVAVKIQGYIEANPSQQNAVLATITPDVYGKCTALLIMVAASEVNGAPLGKSTTDSLGILGGATAYYRKYQLSRGAPETAIDQISAPYYQEGKNLGTQGYFNKYANFCVNKSDAFVAAATKK